MKRRVSVALRSAAKVYLLNRLRADRLEREGLLSVVEAKRERASEAAAFLATLVEDGSRARGAPKGGRVVVGGDALMPAKATLREKPRVKEGRGRERQWRVGLERDVFEAVNEVMGLEGVGVLEAIKRLLRNSVERGEMTESEAGEFVGVLRALYYRARRAETGKGA